MHELSITQTLVMTASGYARGATVRRVTLEIGQLAGVMPDAIRFCFDVCSQGTELEGAQLDILEPPGLGQCRHCGAIIPLDVPYGICDCGSTHIQIIQGNELKLKTLEVDDSHPEELCV